MYIAISAVNGLRVGGPTITELAGDGLQSTQEGEDAQLWVTEILSKDTIEEAKEEYNRVPRLLKEKVKKLLIDAGMEEITE